MTTPPINISSMDFSEIKNSLISYLKDQSYFSTYDYESESTALATLINVLSYNTLFYAYYANMIANESFLQTAQIPQNVLSIIKPLGYVINGTNSSKIIAKIKGDGTAITAYTTSFNGINSSGVNYRFYPIKDYTLNTSLETEVILYNASSLVKDKVINNPNLTLTSSINLDTQSYFIGGFDIDINTITVKVNDGSGIQTWIKYDPYNPTKTNQTNRIYFIERRDDGFYLLFGRSNLDEIFGFMEARLIQKNDIVTISYIKPVGANSNGCALNTTVGSSMTSTLSSGGGTPDIELIKTFAPKLFASSDRAVTKDDYYGVILNSSMLPPSITSEEQIIIWGGEEMSPPLIGRTFYSFADFSLTAQNVKNLTTLLKEKGVISITPEYIPAKRITVNAYFNMIGIPTAELVKAQLELFFNATQKFNKIFSSEECSSFIRTKYPTINNISVSYAELKFTVSRDTNIIELYNKLKKPTSTAVYGSCFNSDTFDALITNVGVKIVKIVDKLSNTQSNIGDLVLYDTGSRQPIKTIGTIDYLTGSIYIKSRELVGLPSSVTCTAIPNSSNYITSSKNNLLSLVANVNKI